MIDWIANQQGALSLALALLIASEHFFTTKIGINLMYRLWLLVPVTLVFNNLPNQITALPSDSFSRYVVGLKPSMEFSDSSLLFTTWATGVCIIAAYICLSYLRLNRSVSPEKVPNTAAHYSSLASTPMLFGFVSPKILLPTGFASLFCPVQQRLILKHEHVHYQHRDHIWNGIALLTALLFWFNPLVWLGVRSFRINQELACDNKVLQYKTTAEKILYAKALVQCAEHSVMHVNLYPTFGGKSTMLKRLHSIKQPVAASKILGVASILLAAAFTTNTALANFPDTHTASAKVNQATPVVRVDPAYPEFAAQHRQEGSVILQFDITETGTTENVKVVESSPKGVFDASAKEALEQWQYKPRIQGGKALRQSDLLVQLDFRLDGKMDAMLPDEETKEVKIVSN